VGPNSCRPLCGMLSNNSISFNRVETRVAATANGTLYQRVNRTIMNGTESLPCSRLQQAPLQVCALPPAFDPDRSPFSAAGTADGSEPPENPEATNVHGSRYSRRSCLFEVREAWPQLDCTQLGRPASGRQRMQNNGRGERVSSEGIPRNVSRA
jgi:hypothetical protein